MQRRVIYMCIVGCVSALGLHAATAQVAPDALIPQTLPNAASAPMVTATPPAPLPAAVKPSNDASANLRSDAATLPPSDAATVPVLAPEVPASDVATSGEDQLPLMPAQVAVSATGVTENGVPLEPGGTVVPSVSPIRYSYGSTELSIFYTPAEINNMKLSLQAYESLRGKDAGGMTTQEAPVINEPAAYPVFYLSSIAYRGPDDWTVWVSGFKITPKKNDTDIKVVTVTRDRATFTWAPIYAQALTSRRDRSLFADVTPVKNKLTQPSSFGFDDAEGVVTFSLKPNQSFVVGYFNTFEGNVPAPSLQPLVANANAAPGSIPPDLQNPQALSPSSMEDMDRAHMDRMLKHQETLDSIAPQKNNP